MRQDSAQTSSNEQLIQTDGVAQSSTNPGSNDESAIIIISPGDVPEDIPVQIDTEVDDTPPDQPEEGSIEYVVVSGDNLTKIAQRFDTSVSTLVELNNLASADALDVGQVLIISNP